MVVLGPLSLIGPAEARSLQIGLTGVVPTDVSTVSPITVGAAAHWVLRPSILYVVPPTVGGAARYPLIALPGHPEVGAYDFAAHGFVSALAQRVDALARAAAELKAEQEAAVVAAVHAAAEEAAAQAAADVAARAVLGFVQRVWTSGFQNEINMCRGAVDVTAIYLVRVIAEHSSCGGSRFPNAAGAIVTITGLDAGRYRVIGVVARLNGEVDHAEDIPRGYDLLYQTCVNGFIDMRFTALERIG